MKRLIIKIIGMYGVFSKNNGYQLLPIFYYPVCRFTPSCSEYTIESVREFGVVKGLYKSLVRFIKCNPLSHS